MAMAQNKGARKAPAARKPRAVNPLQEETMSNTTAPTEGTLTAEIEKPKIINPTYVQTYKVPKGHNGIINPQANFVNLGDAALTSGFTLSELKELGADVDWLLSTGQIEKHELREVSNS